MNEKGIDMIAAERKDAERQSTTVEFFDNLVSILDLSGQVGKEHSLGSPRRRSAEEYLKIAHLRTLKATLDQNSAMTRTFLDAFGDLSQHDETYEGKTREAIATIIGSLVDNQQLVEAFRGRIAENLAEGHFPSARQNASDDMIRLWRRWAKHRTSR
jgi:hypothetical protein